MTTVARITENYELLVTGVLSEGQESISLDGDGNLKATKVYTTLDAFSEVAEIDEDLNLDEGNMIDETEAMETFLSWFFGISIDIVSPNRVQFDNGKYIIANNVLENQKLGGE